MTGLNYRLGTKNELPEVFCHYLSSEYKNQQSNNAVNCVVGVYNYRLIL